MNADNEVWKPVPQFSNVQASSLGNIKRLNLRNGTWQLNASRYRTKRGYWRISLTGTEQLVHRLVAMAFIPNPQALPEINHIDGVKDNNVPPNLEWCTRSHNCLHKYRIGLQISPVGESLPWAKLTEADVRIIFHAVNVLREEQRVVATRFGVSQPTVGYIARGETWKHLKLVP